MAKSTGVPHFASPPTVTATPTLKTLENELNSVENWHKLGVNLGLQGFQLREIEQNYGDSSRCKSEMLDLWLRNTENPSWEAVAEALCRMQEKVVAGDIRRKHCTICSSFTATGPQKSEVTVTPEKSDHRKAFAHENRQAITAKFAAFQTKVCQKLLENGVDSEMFRLFVINQFPPGDCIPRHPTSLLEIFEAITYNGLWDFFHYSPLVRIVQTFGAGDLEMKGWIQSYQKDLKAYLLMTKLEDYIETDGDNSDPPPAMKAKYSPLYCYPVEWKTEFTDHSLQYLTDLWEIFSSCYLMPSSPPTALLDRVRKGCFSITWLIPSRLILYLIKRIQNNSDFFQQHHILRVTVGDLYVYEEVTEETKLEPEHTQQKEILPSKVLLGSEEGTEPPDQQERIGDTDKTPFPVAAGDQTCKVWNQGKYSHGLLEACQYGKVEQVCCLLMSGVSVNKTDITGTTPLFIACQNGNLPIVQLLIAAKADVNLQRKTGATPLFIACEKGHLSVVKQLIEANADVNCQKKDCATPLFIACEEGHFPVVEQLIAAKADVNCAREDGTTPLWIACQEGHLRVVEHLIAMKADVNIPDETGATPLYITCQMGHLPVLQLLIGAKADINCPLEDGTTPLHIACQEGHLPVVQQLIEERADINCPDEDGTTPLHVACQEGHLAVVQQLIKKKADINRPCKTGATPLFIACEEGHLPVVKQLIAAKAHVNRPCENGKTPLYIASQEGHYTVVQILIIAKADVNHPNENGATPLYIACQNEHHPVVQHLIAAKADVNHRDETGATLLFNACQMGHLTVVQQLIAAEADLNCFDEDGYTPLIGASDFGHLSVVRVLLQAGAAINTASHRGETALFFAVQSEHEDIVELLIQDSADPDLPREDGATPLYIACGMGHLPVVQHLISAKADVNRSLQTGETPLYTACEKGHTLIVEQLIAAKADVNCPLEDGATPLYIACEMGHLPVVEHLIAAKADVNHPLVDGSTALMIASYCGHLSIVRVLLQEGATINTTAQLGTALHAAVDGEHEDVVELLLEENINPDLQRKLSQEIALMIAARKGSVGIVRKLIKHGASVHFTNKDGLTALDIAYIEDHMDVCQELHKSLIVT